MAGLCGHEWRGTYEGMRFREEDTAAELGLRDGDEILLHRAQCGGKPVIYLFTPTVMSARVELALVPEWEFSAIYPVAPVSELKNGMTITAWDVDVQADGTMLDQRTSAEVSYLYWEATTTIPCRPPSPPPEGELVAGFKPFNPAQTDVSPSNSVLLNVPDVPAYLDAALTAMTLPTEARTSFITYWLPAILRHKQIALRFLPQEEYEPAAPLKVTPVPDIVTRVFMLFRGVDPDPPLLEWSTHLPTDWASIIGVDTARALEPSLFRVLEWGGMEVISQ
ncbi:hypothetical protein AURDEDRAFT_85731 [Auricularia subglabra TFB-10046 SS5]|nr:hypothetical protein AURDEDRAFT_85731 [Auricularia subglabra TFB-10046 SS5]